MDATRSVFRNPRRRSSFAPLAASDQGPAQKRPRLLTLTPGPPPPGQGGERGRGSRRKGPRGLGRPPVEGEARKETAGPPRRWIEWEKDE